MTLHLYDTYTRSLRPFEPVQSGRVGVYACGPTVYDYAHIGNLRTYVFEDLLRRTLEWVGYNVQHVMNITDVGHLESDADTGEDKMEAGARNAGVTAWEIAERYTAAFQDDLEQLNILPPTVWCRATDHIDEQIAFIQCIESKGFTYQTSDGIYFDSSKVDDYGHLARLDLEGLRAGARVELAEKRSPTDFALWKFSPTDRQRQMEWESPWGMGFPGWHIECSAMSAKYLGELFDIHCGGEDHPPVHHTNEIAQTQACYGTRLANYWLHGAFLQLDSEKMAKSAGGFLRLSTLAERGYEPLAYRYLCLGAHYRARLNFAFEGLDGAQTALGRLRRAIQTDEIADAPDPDFMAQFSAAIEDDLNAPRALAAVWDIVRSGLAPGLKRRTILECDRVLGLGLDAWREADVPDDVLALVDARQQARQDRRWKEADALRDAIHEAGFEVEDSPDGPRIRPR